MKIKKSPYTQLFILFLFLNATPLFSEDSTLEVIIPVQMGLLGTSPAVYTPFGLAVAGNYWLMSPGFDATDETQWDYGWSTFDISDYAIKAGWCFKYMDFDDRPKMGGILGTPLLANLFPTEGHRTTAFSIFAGFERQSTIEKMSDYDVQVLEGLIISNRPFIELEFRNTYTLEPLWIHALQLIFPTFSDFSIATRLYLNDLNKIYTIKNQTAYDKYMTDPVPPGENYDSERAAINAFMERYTGDSNKINLSLFIKWGFFNFYIQEILSGKLDIYAGFLVSFNYSTGKPE